MPTSRATRVTSAANERSWSTIVLMVFFSSRISPFTSTVIFCDRSPAATAVVTSAMFRTCDGEVAGHEVHRVGQVLPRAGHALHVGLAAELPSVPTSRATRVTSAANDRSWSTIVLTVFFSSRISPFTSTVIFLRQVARRHRLRHVGDVPHLRR